jgi:small subunit ribosomal protein S17
MAEQDDTTTESGAATEAPQTAAGEATAPEATAESAGEPEAPTGPASEPQEQLAPKERRARARAAKAAKQPARGPRSAEERQADREARRTTAAKARRVSRAKATAKHKAEAHSRTATSPREHVEGRQKVRQGVVVSDKADKTITVRIDVARRHRRYEKIVRTSRMLHAHDEANDAHVGDTVTVREARPLSRTKRWRLVDVIERAK